MKNLVIASVVASVLGLGISVLWADTAAPTAKPHESLVVRHFQKIGLNLSAEQIAKIDAITKDTHAKSEAVLTADQQKLLADAKGKGKEAMKTAFMEVRKTMTADQKTKMRDIHKASFEQVKAVLTADQLAKLKECHKGYAGHHKGTTGPAPVTPTPAPVVPGPTT